MERITALHLTTEQEKERSSAIFFPNALMGSFLDCLPNQGLALLQCQSEEGLVFDIAPGIIAPANTGEIAIISTRIELFYVLFSGFGGLPPDPQSHETYTAMLQGEPQYFVLEKGMLNLVNVTRDSITKIARSLPDLETYMKRIDVFELAWDGGAVHVVIDEPHQEGLNAVLVDLEAKYYIPESQRVRFFVKAETQEEGEDITQAKKAFLVVNNGTEINRIFPQENITRLTRQQEVAFCLNQKLELGLEVYLIEGIKIDAGFYVEDVYKKDVEDDKERSLQELMESL